MSNIRVGTASWTDKSLIDSGRFYPADAKSAKDRLRSYAAQFPMVEVDSSYYAIPVAQTASLWAERTPRDFRFNVKAFRLFTGHQTSPTVLSKDVRAALPPSSRKNVHYKDMVEELRDELWRQFREALEPLRAAGKLVAVHFQFAPWMAFHPENFAHVEACQAQLPGCLLAVEFRNASWFTDKHTQRTLAFERERGFVNVIVDGPQGFANSVPSIWEMTHPSLAIHNNYEDQGQRNGATLQKLLGG